jgi:hypothetical protein
VEHAEVQEGEVVLCLAVAAGGDPASRFQPGVRALDRPAMSCLRITRLSCRFLPRQTSRVACPAGTGSSRRRRLLMQGSIRRSRSASESALES